MLRSERESVKKGRKRGREMLMHEELRCAFLKGQRNGNWKKLTRIEKAFYRAALSYTMPRRGVGRSIVSESVVNKLLVLIKRLLETPSQRIFKRGFEKAVKLIRKIAIKSGVLLSALNNWLRNPDYIFWLELCRGAHDLKTFRFFPQRAKAKRRILLLLHALVVKSVGAQESSPAGVVSARASETAKFFKDIKLVKPTTWKIKMPETTPFILCIYGGFIEKEIVRTLYSFGLIKSDELLYVEEHNHGEPL